MTLKDLRNKWNKNREFYKRQEVGLGVQDLIIDFLKNEELFSLKKSSPITKLELRKNEYFYEKKAKESRQADFVIYINSDIVIPLEAECYGNIQAGVKQLINYQKDFDKHYGILTDGYTWRFYNNNIYREFNLDQIFDEADIFLEFWKEYIKPESYYLTFFEPQGQRSFLKEEKLPVEENRQIFFDDITKLIRSFKNKLRVEGYFEGLDKKDREKKAVEITYAYVIQFILYKTLVDNEFDDFNQEFKDIVKAIHDCLKVKQYGKILGVIEGISNKISENIYRPFKKEQDFINQILLNLYRQPKNEIHNVAPWLDIFVFIKKYYFANIQNEIFGYIYENYLKELYEDTKKGQYFTDPAIVNFMLQQVGFTPEALQKRYQYDKDCISLIDPSCGSGTFLYSAVDSILKAFGNSSLEKSEQVEKIINDNVFGLDIAEFPLYLAEMSILMRMLPQIINEKYNNPVEKKIKVFLTKDSISEFMDTALRNTFNDQTVEFQKKANSPNQIPLFTQKLDLGYKSYVREESDLEEMKKSLENQPECLRRRFDFVIGNPPYISYNECAKQGVLIFRLMREDKAKLSNIYGMNLHSIPENKKKYPPKPNLYSFFIALGLALLKDQGRLCFIIPQTILTESDYDVLRYHLSEFATIEKIITFTNPLFTGRGLRQRTKISTSSLIFVVNREKAKQLHKVEVVNYVGLDDDINDTLTNILKGKKVINKKILQQDFRRNVANWNFIKQDKKILDFGREYKNNSDDFSIYYDHKLASHYFGSNFYFDVGFILDKKYILKKTTQGVKYFDLVDFRKFIGFYKYLPTLFYPYDKSKIKLPKNSQGYVTLEKRYKIIWSKVYSQKFYFTDRNILPSMSYTQFIASDDKKELLYLFSLLNSPVNKLLFNSLFQLENEQYGSFLVIKRIKEFVRVPRITEDNQPIKDEIIKRTEEMLALEDKILSDYVDFSKIMIQKTDSTSVDDGFLVLEKDSKKIRLPIKDKKHLVRKAIEEKYAANGLGLNKQVINVSGLKNLLVVDYERQNNLKNYIDDLVFALYFNISLPYIGINKAEEVRKMCVKSSYYNLVSETLL